MSDAPPTAPPVPEPPLPPSGRLRVVYVVLALLVGPLGCHNFYVGRWLRGALQLALSVPGLVVMLQWMREIEPLAASLSGSDPAEAVAQLSQLGLPDSPFLLGILASTVWAAADLFAVKTDAKGRTLR